MTGESVRTRSTCVFAANCPNQAWLQPHLRLYAQRRADFYTTSFSQDQSLPQFASSDQRLGNLRSATLGATYGFRLPDFRGEFTVRAEYMVQWGDGHPTDAIGVQRQMNLYPPESVGSLLVGYSLGW